MTKIIGLTGGIGSGKTYVARLFEEKGVPIYLADDEAKKISESKEVNVKIKDYFGETVFENGVLDRKKLGAIVFNDAKKLAALNSIIHPLVRQRFLDWVKQQEAPFVLKEAAILFESKSNQDCTIVITVEAPIEERIKRVVLRDGLTEEGVKSRISRQMTAQERMEKSDFVIQNIDKEETKKEVNRIWELITKEDVNV
ncbi:MAG: dephospho-CoA kinase [Flavobacteriales bacterium]|nr:dephospho-CoA kinase [Flavobacteriales bacterium]